MLNRKIMLFTLAAVSAVTLSTAAMAESSWQRNHPRREQVNARLANQDRRIHNEAKEGELTHGQAVALHHEDRQIRHEERLMASQNGGHITKQEQRALKQQESAVSRQIGK